MTLDQALAFAIILGTIGLLIWDRVRYDLVALMALLASIACGIVKPAEAFRGFSDDIVIIVGSALVVSAAISRSGLVETLMKPLVPRMGTSVMQVAVLASAVTALSAFIKNIGALAIFIPIALQVARRTEKPPSRVLMPLAFGSLLGGLITLIGTVAQYRSCRACASRSPASRSACSTSRRWASAWPSRASASSPSAGGCCRGSRRGAGATPETRFSIEDYITEVRLPAASPYVGKTVRDLEALGDGDVTVAAIIREGYRRYIPAGYWPLFEGDILVLEADTHALSRLVDGAKLELIHEQEAGTGRGARGRSGGGRGGGHAELDHDRQHGRAACAARTLWPEPAGGQPLRPQDRAAAAPRPLPGRRSARAAGPRRADQRQARRARLPASGRAERTPGAPAQPVPAGRDPRGRDGPGDDGYGIGAGRLLRRRGSDAGRCRC